MTAIKPCPFCGVTDVGFHEGSTFRWVFAHCKNCGAQAPEVRRDTLTSDEDADLSEALEEWNRRDGK